MPQIFPFTKLFDSHCHLNTGVLKDNRTDLVKQAKASGVDKIIDVAIDLNSAVDTLADAQEFPGVVYPTIGLHPELCVMGSDIYDPGLNYEKIDQQIEKMRFLLQSENYFMVGECGIDLYWLRKNNFTHTIFKKSLELQTYLLVRQLELAAEFNLPLTIHQRDSFDEIMSALKPFAGKINGVMHSFTGTYEQAKQIFDLGFAIGINGIITYTSASELRETIKRIISGKKIAQPEDLYNLGIYLETDAPFLPPKGFRGEYNTPAALKYTLEFLLAL